MIAPYKSVLAKRILAYILVFSSLITLLATGWVLMGDYKRDVSKIEENLNQIQDGYLESIAHSLWNMDQDQMSIQLRALLNYAEIHYVYIKDESGFFIEEGKPNTSGKTLVEELKLHKKNQSLGSLFLHVSYDGVIDDLKDKAISILLTQFLKTMLVSTFILFIIQHFVNRHMSKMADYARGFNLTTLDVPLVLDGRKAWQDELDDVADALNYMREALRDDMKRREEAEAELREKQMTLSLAVNTAALAIFDIDVEEDRLTFNSQFSDQFCCSKEFIVRQPKAKEWMLNRIQNEDIRLLLDAQMEALRTQDLELIHLQYPLLDYEEKVKHIMLSMTFRAATEQDKARWVGCQWDITELVETTKKVEELNATLEKKVTDRTQRLQRSNEGLSSALERMKILVKELRETQEQLILSEKMATVGGLVAGVAHELNTPLGVCMTSVSGLNEMAKNINSDVENNLLTKKGLSGYVENLVNYADLINSNLDRAVKIVKVFKLLSVEGGKESLIRFELNQTMLEIVELLRLRKPQNIELTFEESEKVLIETYRGALTQVIEGLIGNAFQHAFQEDQEGLVSVFVGREKDDIIIEVSDNGNGIPEEVKQRIFEAFFTTKRNKGGIGLGLSIIYNLITQLLKGRIECDSQMGSGTLFRLRLPSKLEVVHSQDSQEMIGDLSDLYNEALFQDDSVI
jgi:signal transduction histidine kinase